MQKVENGKMIAIEYRVRNQESNEVVDENVGGEPLEFLMGASQVIVGLEKGLEGMSEGESKEIVVSPEDAYGEYRIDFLQEVPREQFEGIDLKEGMTLFGHGEDGRSVQVIVKSFNDKSVMIDYNHPLAGATLVFDVTIKGIREATDADFMAMGGGCGCGGHHGEDHHHGEGGCCGGGGGCCGGHH